MRILSIDGGGIRGIIPAMLLKLIHREQKSINTYFDIVAGTSTGGIIAQALAYGYSPSEIHSLYINKGADIFTKNKYSFNGWARPKYSLRGMQKVFDNKFSNAKISQSLQHTILTAYDFEGRNMVYFDSEAAKNNPSYDVTMKDAVIATAAAPSFFPAHKMNYKARPALMSDGGAAAHNNPVLVALMRALEKEKDTSKIKVLSLGTGIHEKPIKKLLGIPTILKPVIEAQMDGSSELGHLFTETLIKDNYLRVQFRLPKSLQAMDNVSYENMKQLNKVAERIYLENYASIVQFFND